jgi:hypothetical protein
VTVPYVCTLVFLSNSEGDPSVPHWLIPSSSVTSVIKRGTGLTDSEPPKIFLVADGPNRTTKYLMALAAGIPCLDQGWVYDEVSLKYITFTPFTNQYVRMSVRGLHTFFQLAGLLA